MSTGDDNSLEGICAATVEIAFDRSIDGKPILLTDNGRLAQPLKSVIYPERLFKIWDVKTVVDAFDAEKRPPFCGLVDLEDISKF